MSREQKGNQNESSTVDKFLSGLQIATGVINFAVQMADLFGGSAQTNNQQARKGQNSQQNRNKQNNRPANAGSRAAANQHSSNAGKRTNPNQNRKPANNSNRNNNAPRSNSQPNASRPKTVNLGAGKPNNQPSATRSKTNHFKWAQKANAGISSSLVAANLDLIEFLSNLFWFAFWTFF